jgi:hypothetical protein
LAYLCEGVWAPEIAGTRKTPVVSGAGSEVLEKTCVVREVPVASFTAHIPDGFVRVVAVIIAITIITIRVVGGGIPILVERRILQVLCNEKVINGTPHKEKGWLHTWFNDVTVVNNL